MAIQLSKSSKERREPSCRVMVVDDSAVARGIVTRTLEEEDGIKVVASVPNGLMALKAAGNHEIDVVVLDIEMPELDGLAALPRLLELKPDLKVIMVSSASQRDADISLKTMAMGAADYVAKPKAGLGGAESFRAELVSKVREHGTGAGKAAVRHPPSPRQNAASAREEEVARNPARPNRAPSKPDVIAIGSSTGGPQALAEVLRDLDPALTQPILVTQHMPATFTGFLAEHMTRYSGRSATEARDGEVLEPGRIYIAPGGKHMLVERRAAGGTIIRLDDGPPENSCKPAVDPMLRSLAKAFQDRLLVVILTGMGSDGLKGCEAVQKEGGRIFAQDRESSVVWGMPGAVAQAGICEEILPLRKIGPAIIRIAGGEGK
ncbi:chemotaxis response regulator protein-glutamate methylesterase [Parvibaculum sp.]|uniref:protein-glutamate methylesterase/protein-glutamine glutaminase n=1 Tax=Parvibaculum sp. TaxID=2024848 RepID=UPI001B202206|nr:chemotaxis response regulator protein-glutamate methylesterase [Parvibaculum sp.]MBO6668198.1 chemotaxis response regulator protein-glutamate methylesterase [Parvibaculum sp.]MBO6691732.1 chemotaxis response regulator protein-glutamate methylesterase [Parvibaculum sp.]MBO6714684.1 chemotaxis response regulator protein-glutamate methylesterase [Parvibaculum sp.]